MSETTTPTIQRAEDNFFIDGEKVGFIHPTSGKLQMLPGMKAHRPAIEAYLGLELAAPAEVKEAPAEKIKGEIPPCPPMDPTAGDKTPAVIEWYFKFKPEEAAVKYAKRRYSLEAHATTSN